MELKVAFRGCRGNAIFYFLAHSGSFGPACQCDKRDASNHRNRDEDEKRGFQTARESNKKQTVSCSLFPTIPRSRLNGSEIDGELDGVGDGDADVAQLNFAERQRLERQSAALQLAKMGVESAARERPDWAVAFAFELRNFRHEIAVEVELDGDVDLSAQKKFSRSYPNIGGDGARATRAHREANLLDYDSVPAGFTATDFDNRVFKIGLCGGNDNLPVAHFVGDQDDLAVSVAALMKNDIARFHSQVQRHAAHGNIPCT